MDDMPGDLPDRMGFGRAQPCFFLTVWFQRERGEALQIVAAVEHVFSSIGEVSHGEWHGLRTGNGGSSPAVDEVSARCFETWSSDSGSWGRQHRSNSGSTLAG